MTRTPEVWRPIPNRTGYEVSSYGRVRGVERSVTYIKQVGRRRFPVTRRVPPVLRKLARLTHGYITVSFGDGGSTLVADLVLTAFVGARPAGTKAHYIDGDRSNVSLRNLIWARPAERVFDAVKNRNRPWLRGIFDDHAGAGS